MSDSSRPHGLQHSRLLCPSPSLQNISRSLPQWYWSGLPCPLPGDLPNPGIEPRSPSLQVDSLLSEPPEKSKNLGWVALPMPSPGDLPDLGAELGYPSLQANSLSAELPTGPRVGEGSTMGCYLSALRQWGEQLSLPGAGRALGRGPRDRRPLGERHSQPTMTLGEEPREPSPCPCPFPYPSPTGSQSTGRPLMGSTRVCLPGERQRADLLFIQLCVRHRVSWGRCGCR